MRIMRELESVLGEQGCEADPELIKAYAMLRLGKAIEDIGLHAFGTDAARVGQDQRSIFERLAVDLPQALNEVASAIRERDEP